jgi:hypothetical protein
LVPSKSSRRATAAGDGSASASAAACRDGGGDRKDREPVNIGAADVSFEVRSKLRPRRNEINSIGQS